MDDHVDATRRLPGSAEQFDRTIIAPPARVRRGAWRGWLIALLILLAAGYGIWRVATTQGGGRTGVTRAAPPQSVGVATASTGDARVILDGLGTVSPLTTVTVRTQIAGTLMYEGFTEGQMVHRGDFIIQIDPRPYQAALEVDEGQLAKDQALLKQAQADLARYQTLLKQDSIARQQAEDQIYLVQQDQAAIRSDQAQIDTQKLNLVYCHITSPVDGRVGLRQVDPGNYVTPSDTNGLVVITQTQPISVIFTLPEDDLPQVLARFHTGAKLPVLAYDRANMRLLATGELSNIDNQVDTTTGTWKMRANFANPDEMLFPSQFVNARLLVDTLHNVVVVPTAAVQHGAPGSFVYVVQPDDTVAVRVVKTGVIDGEREQIVSGLAAGDRVVIDGIDRLKDGAKVRVTQPAAPTQTQDNAAPAGSAPGHHHQHDSSGGGAAQPQ
jgi:multidrug efflux system membrane fusion protein